MKRNLITIILIALLVLVLLGASRWYSSLSAGFSPEEPSPAAGQETPAPEATVVLASDFTVLDGEGNQVRLSEYFGKPIVVNFWATWCGPCKRELPAFDSVYLEYGQQVEFMMVNLTDGARDTTEGVKSFVSENGYSFPVYFDTSVDAARVYGVYSIPMTVFIAADGSVSRSMLGSMDEQTLLRYIEEIADITQ